MSMLTATGIERDGIDVMSVAQTESGAFVIVHGMMDPAELDHASALLKEMAGNARAREAARIRNLQNEAMAALADGPTEFLALAARLSWGQASHALIVRVVESITGISARDILSEYRFAHFVKARQILYWLCQQFTRLSLKEIGRRTGGRDHTSVLHGCRRVQSIQRARRVKPPADPVSWARELWNAEWPDQRRLVLQCA